MSMKISQEYVKELFFYRGGKLYWRVSESNRVTIGKEAGCKQENSYRVVGIGGKVYMAHRLVWIYHHGYMPEGMIDHINKNPMDNRIDNLREVDKKCNARNCGNPKNNTSGVKGVSFCPNRKKWKAYISDDGKQSLLGRHKDFEEAVLHRFAAEQCLDWAGCDSDSPSYKYYKECINA